MSNIVRFPRMQFGGPRVVRPAAGELIVLPVGKRAFQQSFATLFGGGESAAIKRIKRKYPRVWK